MNMKLPLTAALLGLLTMGVGACDDSEASDPGSSPRVTVSYTIVYTAGWGCRDCDFKNSPWLGSYPVPVLGYGPGAKPDLPTIVEAYDKNGTAWPVAFDHGALVVWEKDVPVMGGDLVGYSLVIKIPDEEAFEIDIHSYRDVEDWTDNHEKIPTYGFSRYEPSVDAWVNLCPGQDLDETSVVFIEDETYDLHAAGVGAASAASDTVTLGCRGHALAKMKLLGYEPTSPYFTSSPEERVATLRMVTADYCGDGSSYTQFGTAVDWTDTPGHVQYDASTMGTYIEAEWDETGATCFMQPRVQGNLPACNNNKTIAKCIDEEYSAPSGGTIWTSIIP